jgi:hypothetical protein
VLGVPHHWLLRPDNRQHAYASNAAQTDPSD